jgi:hypothetical protein
MPVTSPVDLLFDADPSPSLLDLAQSGTNDRAVVSCYLDARAGAQRCLAFLNRKAAHIRNALTGVERLDFDSAIEAIRRKLEKTLPSGCQGVALFSRAAMIDRQLTLVQTTTPLDNRLVYSRAPEILPLLALHQRMPSGNLLLVRDGAFELLPIGVGMQRGPICSGPLPSTAQPSTEANRPVTAAFGRRDRQGVNDLQRQLGDALSTSRGPLLLAGPAAALADLSEWLPAQAIERLVGCIRPADGASRRSVIEDAQSQLSALSRAEARRLAVATLEHRHTGAAVVGFRSVLETLEADAAATLVVSDWDQFGLGLPWESKVTLCFEALRNGCRVVLCDSVALREAGGVGCLLRRARKEEAADIDTTAGRLQNVA